MNHWQRNLGLFCLLVAVLWAGCRVWKHIPPFEQGLHTESLGEIEVHASSTLGTGAGAPHLGPCPVFPTDNIWNTPIDRMPKSKLSQAYIDKIGPFKKLHPDFASVLLIGIPYTEIQPDTAPVPVAFDYAEESDPGPYRIPQNVPIEGGAAATGDRHVILVDPRRCLLEEMWDSHLKPDGTWHSGSGARYDLTGNTLRPDSRGSADAAGLPILPGLVRFEEVQAGSINHALRFTLPLTAGSYLWPARHKASKNMHLDVPPMGLRFRLRADFDLSRYSFANQVILKALQRYGMFLADNGSAMFLSGVPDKRWDDSDLHKLGNVNADDFEAIDESSLQLLPDSARVDPVALPR